MGHTYLRMPRVQRLKYLIAFLESFKNNEFDEKEAHKAIQQQIHHFEIEKAKALGRQRPRMRKGAYTVQECSRMSSALGLIDRFKRLTPQAARVLDSSHRRRFLLEQMWEVYPRFGQVVLTARDAGQLNLPFYNWDSFRQEGGNLYGLEFDRLNFEIIRDLATQLELINWYPTEEKGQVVYPVACVATFTEIIYLAGHPVENETLAQQCLHQTALDLNLLAVHNNRYEAQGRIESDHQKYLILQLESDRVFIRDHEISFEDFEQTLWQEYLNLSSMRPRFPVLYPNLRNQVCHILRISDHVFDQHLLTLIQQPQRLNIFPSGGVLNYSANLAHIGKFLPPKTTQGNFIVYLKIERRSTS